MRPVALDLDDDLLGERVDHRDAHAVEAAGHLVGLVVELAAGVQDGEDDLERRRSSSGDAWPTGMPRPLSSTVTELSGWTVTLILVQKPAMASSTELSTISHTRWCRPADEVVPMYMPGRLRTASRPSRTLISLASYELSFFFAT
jgi:hypothetical protein